MHNENANSDVDLSGEAAWMCTQGCAQEDIEAKRRAACASADEAMDVDEEADDDEPKRRKEAKAMMDDAEKEYANSEEIEACGDAVSAAAWIARRMNEVTTEGGKTFLGNLAEQVAELMSHWAGSWDTTRSHQKW